MAYNIYITRAPRWHSENENHRIKKTKWLQVVRSDPELVEEGSASGIGDHNMTAWAPLGPNGAWLDWREGNVYSENPQGSLIEKMVEMAKKLGAKVQGDDGEVYLGGGKSVRPPKG